jgi:hypothetical protein
VLPTNPLQPLTVRTQDSVNARLSDCAIPYLSIIPAIIILVIAIEAFIGRFLWRWRPKWTKPFVTEKIDNTSDLPSSIYHRSWKWTTTLFILSIVAIASEAAQLVVAGPDVTATMLVFSWVRSKQLLTSP